MTKRPTPCRILPVSEESIAEAAALIRSGSLVAFPTETVYGLGADATSDAAVVRIFAAKGRPRFNPLISHFADAASAFAMVAANAAAERLAARFWPGALSLVLPRRSGGADRLSLLVSAGLPTAAVRVPGGEAARCLIAAAGVPIAAPSANLSGRLSPTEAAHVAAQLGDMVALILDGGRCPVGVESTVVDLSGPRPTLLRPGGVAAEVIEDALGQPLAAAGTDAAAPKSPGMLASHYAPTLPVRLNAAAARPGEALLGFGPAPAATLNLSARGDLAEAAANLFGHLHRLDTAPHSAIAVMPIPERGLGRAINDRLRRAAAAH